ncbi:PhnD/SsuA/transferrin family substrate-binding protein [Microseira wollei]|uniref:Extracellular ligand-binding receptor n=1 Tax=Microseira wollei NIES-4236 TaxID=2530354 RepID=A0AAV3XG78_9CYAN|nr:PhnD/SsuA/transferrin family substrate-binding protein [Microseira wollei]GET40513.1 extracellular ligand-binding receptor [Microseira wollei NIES-4236]
MSKVVVLKLERGDFERGFQVTLDVAEEGKFPYIMGVSGYLRQAPEIPELYRDWQRKYYNLESIYRRKRLYFIDETAGAPSEQPGNLLQECYEAAEKLKVSFQEWLRCDGFRTIEAELLANLSKSDRVRFILQTDDDQLRKLPWETWSFFQRFPQADLGISSLISYSYKQLPKPAKLKILAILGNSDGIDIQSDRKILENLPLADVCFLVEPTREQFKSLWQSSWDILFFAGHSSSQDGEKGYLYINQTPEGKLEISELEETLRTAIDLGLKLAIFNSCDGLGLARQLEKLHIPQAIVMREPVPDKIAQKFLQYFLEDFSQGGSLYTSVRRSRIILRELLQVDREFPGASWVPVICQNPAAEQFVWPSPRRKYLWLDSIIKLKQYAWVAIFSGFAGSAITVTATWTNFTRSPCPLATEKKEALGCFKDLQKTPLVIGFLAAPHQNLYPNDHLYLAFENYLKKELGINVRDVRIKFGNAISYQEIKKKIADNEWDIIFTNSPMNSWTAKSNGYSWLGRQYLQNPSYYYSVLFVKANSPIRSIADIKPTTTIALGYIGSASSFHVPLYNLYGKSLSITLGHSHEKIQELVRSGKADIGASTHHIAANPEWRVIHRSKAIPISGIFISPKLSPSDQTRIKQIFKQAPTDIKNMILFKSSPEINYESMGAVSDKVEKIVKCTNYFDKNPVDLYCK